MNTKTIEIDTLSFLENTEQLELFDKDVLALDYLNTLKFLNGRRMHDFVTTSDFSHYVQALRIKKQIRGILGE